ncbi:hypothetical protein V8E55_007912 [Tylopilus felleus]
MSKKRTLETSVPVASVFDQYPVQPILACRGAPAKKQLTFRFHQICKVVYLDPFHHSWYIGSDLHDFGISPLRQESVFVRSPWAETSWARGCGVSALSEILNAGTKKLAADMRFTGWAVNVDENWVSSMIKIRFVGGQMSIVVWRLVDPQCDSSAEDLSQHVWKPSTLEKPQKVMVLTMDVTCRAYRRHIASSQGYGMVGNSEDAPQIFDGCF